MASAQVILSVPQVSQVKFECVFSVPQVYGVGQLPTKESLLP